MSITEQDAEVLIRLLNESEKREGGLSGGERNIRDRLLNEFHRQLITKWDGPEFLKKDFIKPYPVGDE